MSGEPGLGAVPLAGAGAPPPRRRGPRPGRVARRLLRLLLATAGLLAAVPALVIAACRAFDLPTPGPQLAAATLPALAAAVVSALLLLAARAWRTAAAPIALVALLAVWAFPPGAAQAADGRGVSGAPLRLMTQNALHGDADPAQIMDAVRTQGVDVLVVEELTPELADAIDAAGGRERFAYRGGRSHTGAAGTGIWSRYPLQDQGELPTQAFAMPRVTLTLDGGRKVTLIGVHTLSPIPSQVPGWRTDLETLRDVVAETDGPLILAGDFNASRDHALFRAVLAAGVVDAGDVRGAAEWPGVTWPADRPGPAMTRIDHVLVTARYVKVTKLRVATVTGTDHHGLVASLVVPG